MAKHCNTALRPSTSGARSISDRAKRSCNKWHSSICRLTFGNVCYCDVNPSIPIFNRVNLWMDNPHYRAQHTSTRRCVTTTTINFIDLYGSCTQQPTRRVASVGWCFFVHSRSWMCVWMNVFVSCWCMCVCICNRWCYWPTILRWTEGLEIDWFFDGKF